MHYNSIVNRFRNKFGKSDKVDWISERLDEIENHQGNDDTIPFRIVGVKDAGFLTKVKGVFSYISFYYMPWKYNDIDFWKAIAPKLIGKKFLGKIYRIDKDPIAIVLNGDFPQFENAELTIGEEYKGLIIKTADYGLLIDIGYHFDWKCGSVVGLLHKRQLSDSENLEDYKLGQEIQTIYHKRNKKGQIGFCNDREKVDWEIGKPQKLIGQTTWATVIRHDDNTTIDLLVEGKYRAILKVDKKAFAPKYRKEIKSAKNQLKDTEIIHCEVTGILETDKMLKVNWLTEIDTYMVVDNSIVNILDNEALEKLMKLKNNT